MPNIGADTMKHSKHHDLLLHHPGENVLTQDKLKHHLHYAPNTGVFHWIVPTSKRHEHGHVAGGFDRRGVPMIHLHRETYRADRLAILYTYGYMPEYVEHLDGRQTNNILSNLLATDQPPTPTATLRKSNKSGVTGVNWVKSRKRWEAKIGSYGGQIHLGHFMDLTKAVEKRYEAELLLTPNVDHTKSSAYHYLCRQLLK